MNSKWSDLNRDGRRIEGMIKRMNTEFWKTDDPELMISYLEALVRATKAKIEITDRILGVKKVLANRSKEDAYVQ